MSPVEQVILPSVSDGLLICNAGVVTLHHRGVDSVGLHPTTERSYFYFYTVIVKNSKGTQFCLLLCKLLLSFTNYSKKSKISFGCSEDCPSTPGDHHHTMRPPGTCEGLERRRQGRGRCSGRASTAPGCSDKSCSTLHDMRMTYSLQCLCAMEIQNYSYSKLPIVSP